MCDEVEVISEHKIQEDALRQCFERHMVILDPTGRKVEDISEEVLSLRSDIKGMNLDQTGTVFLIVVMEHGLRKTSSTLGRI